MLLQLLFGNLDLLGSTAQFLILMRAWFSKRANPEKSYANDNIACSIFEVFESQAHPNLAFVWLRQLRHHQTSAWVFKET